MRSDYPSYRNSQSLTIGAAKEASVASRPVRSKTQAAAAEKFAHRDPSVISNRGDGDSPIKL